MYHPHMGKTTSQEVRGWFDTVTQTYRGLSGEERRQAEARAREAEAQARIAEASRGTLQPSGGDTQKVLLYGGLGIAAIAAIYYLTR